MPFTLKIICKDGKVIESPFIVPNNPNTGMDDPSITNVIVNIGASIMKKDKDVIKCECGVY